MSSIFRKLGITAILFGMIAPIFWERLISRQFPKTHESGEYYGATRADDVFALQLAAAALPFAIAGWLLWLDNKSLVWQQRFILALATTLVGLLTILTACLILERLIH